MVLFFENIEENIPWLEPFRSLSSFSREVLLVVLDGCLEKSDLLSLFITSFCLRKITTSSIVGRTEGLCWSILSINFLELALGRLLKIS